MQPISKEYLTLFNAVTDAEETLQRLRTDLMAAQQQAEELYIAGGADEAPADQTT